MRRVAANRLNKQSWTAEEGWSSSLGVGRDAYNLSLQKTYGTKHSHSGCLLWRQNSPEVNYSPLGFPGGGVVFLGETLRSRQRGMKIGTWNIRSLYRAGSLKAAVRELVRYKIDILYVPKYEM